MIPESMAGQIPGAWMHPVDADLVVGVPESGNAAAMGFALQSGIPYGTAFVKNSYVGRTFIKPKQSSQGIQCACQIECIKRSGSRASVLS